MEDDIMSIGLLYDIIYSIFQIDTLVAMAVGIFFGIVIGALPGLSAPLGIALLIPVTFGMRPAPALIMLAVLYTSAVYGGSISAILIHTPGTSASAATALDGYQMTLQGKGLQALGLSTLYSMIGGTCSGIALLFLAPPLAKVSLMFGPPEYFMVALFGLTIIGSLASGNVLKGLWAGIIGMLLSTVGMDINTGVYRFTFGSRSLMDGISTVPAMIGLFSLSQVLIQSEDFLALIKKRFESKDIYLSGKMLPNKKQFLAHIPNALRSTLIGIFVGILPGAGADIGSWVSYNEAKRWSKNKEMFGKGNPEGVVASETSNNAVTGGALIPLLTLGIPGSAAVAVLFGALLIHGLTPGYTLFTKNADVVYTMIVAFVIGNILMGLVGFAIAKHVVHVCNVPGCILLPVIVVLSTVGAYAIQLNGFHVSIMAAFGILGYLMRKMNIPPAPLVLGLLLGSIAEDGFVQSITIAKQSPVIQLFVTRPICIVLSVLIIISLLSPLIVQFASKRVKGVAEKKPDQILEDD
jgi:putative tricarboxylic transport membrane protein